MNGQDETDKPGCEPSLWELLDESPVADCGVFKIVRRTERKIRGGRTGEFSIIKAFDWVVALASPRKGEYLLVNQYRFGIDALSWEFPAGCMDAGESPAEAAARELQEETGYAPAGPGRVLGKVHPNPALQDNTCWFVLFEKLGEGGATNWDQFEEMQLRTVPIDEIRRMALDGRISHGMVHAALFMLEQSGGQD
jgi:8-oxo-dGTP pyrophosphatase MutT (NUDIX family)